jgi:hypothetical protein
MWFKMAGETTLMSASALNWQIQGRRQKNSRRRYNHHCNSLTKGFRFRATPDHLGSDFGNPEP